MENIQFTPDYIFEVSWEVCNKVGGIHTVVATKAQTLATAWKEHFILIGPDLTSHAGVNPEFTEDATLFPTWTQRMTAQGLRVRTGRWNIAGAPLVLLIDFTSLYPQKNDIFTDLWVKFRLDSLSGQWDYTDPALFGYAAGMAISCFYECHINATDKVIAQFHEWLTGAGVLYLEEKVPQVATVFTTHATVVGRAVAGSGASSPLPAGTAEAVKKAAELGITSKHSLEKLAAGTADCFTAVSAQTGEECEKLLGVIPDFITSNGFAPGPGASMEQRGRARQRLLEVARALLYPDITDDSFLILKSGRYEFINKGIDIFIKSLKRLADTGGAPKKVIAFIFVPAPHTGPVSELLTALDHGTSLQKQGIAITHNLINLPTDAIAGSLRATGLNETRSVNVIFAPVYLDGHDGIFNMDYYELLPAFDLGIFPSYYEPWGYTPLESIAYGVPAITSSLSGFGRAVAKLPGNGVVVVERQAGDADATASFIAGIIRQRAGQPAADTANDRQQALETSRHFTWQQLIGAYYMAYDLSIQKSMQRETYYHSKPQATTVLPQHVPEAPSWRELHIRQNIPAALQPLAELAGNLWWSWHRIAHDLFAYADRICATTFAAQPHLLLPSLDYTRMQLLINEPRFMAMLTGVMELYRHDVPGTPKAGPLTAYFSPEYALYQPMKIYAGGLGVLAGDYLKTAADKGSHLIAIGLFYRKGYFRQQISVKGEQISLPELQSYEQLPISSVQTTDGQPLTITLPFPGRTLTACAWLVKVGNIPLYLLDTNLPQNAPGDADITSQLYPADTGMRLQQELLLGMGGVKLIAALQLEPDVCHINEGHAAFAGLERISRLMRHHHLDFDAAMEMVKASTLFTTHTAVPAGIHIYQEEQLRPYLSYLTRELGINWEELMQLGKAPAARDSSFSMFYFASRLAQQVNAVSQQHREVTCRLLQPLWPAFRAQELPVTAVTNGIHFPSWLATDWPESLLNHPGTINDMEPAAMWHTRLQLKQKMITAVRERLLQMPFYDAAPTSFIHDPLAEQALFIGFARRFAPYKRADLLFTDTDRLAAILCHTDRPIYLVMAGKAHPNDHTGNALLTSILQQSRQPAFKDHIIFLEDYDLDTAALLVQGVDVWLNTPRLQEEACGTSGMKAILNGALHCSTADGWWAEGWQEGAGWMIGRHTGAWQQQEAEELYKILEQQVAPLFYARNAESLPGKWLRSIRKSMAAVLPSFDMKRAAGDYQTLYDILYKRANLLSNDSYRLLLTFSQWKQSVRDAWHELHVFSLTAPADKDKVYKTGDLFVASMELYLGALSAEDISIDLLFSRPGNTEAYIQTARLALQPGKGNRRTFAVSLPLTHAGACTYTFRICPQHPLLLNKQDLPLVMWT